MKNKYYFNVILLVNKPLLHNCNITVTEMRLHAIVKIYKVSVRKFNYRI